MKKQKQFKCLFWTRYSIMAAIGRPPLDVGRDFLERFARIRDAEHKAEEAYIRAIDLKGASSYSGDRVQIGRTGDPTFQNALRLAGVRDKYSRIQLQYDDALRDLDRVLSRVKPPVLRTVIALYYVDGRTVAEISRILVKRDGTGYQPNSISHMKAQATAEIGKTLLELLEMAKNQP